MYPLGPRELSLFCDSPSTGNILAPNLHSLKTQGSLSSFPPPSSILPYPPSKAETKRPKCLRGKQVYESLPLGKGSTSWRVMLISIQRTVSVPWKAWAVTCDLRQIAYWVCASVFSSVISMGQCFYEPYNKPYKVQRHAFFHFYSGPIFTSHFTN